MLAFLFTMGVPFGEASSFPLVSLPYSTFLSIYLSFLHNTYSQFKLCFVFHVLKLVLCLIIITDSFIINIFGALSFYQIKDLSKEHICSVYFFLTVGSFFK